MLMLEVLPSSLTSVLACFHEKDQPYFGTICTGTEHRIHELFMPHVQLCSVLNGLPTNGSTNEARSLNTRVH
uniref:Putative secreted protein n=1 Tax=Anopheles darlingi TaxID=43151 RepID=A0A2M4DC56_ANODA